jgi:transcriptional regulator with XRE-family HTH domain
MKEVEAQLGYSRRSLSMIERNQMNPSQEKLHKLAALLDVPVADLEQVPVLIWRGKNGGPEKPPEHTPTGEFYLGSLIRNLRHERGLEIEDVGRQVAYARHSMLKIEQNLSNPPKKKLHKLAELLDVPVADLEQAPAHPRIATKNRK